METTNPIITAVITLSLFIILFGLMMVFVVSKYFKRKRKLLLEKEMMEVRYRHEQLQAQLEIQEQTFNTISQEIHDNVGQMLSLVKVQLNMIGDKETTDAILVTEAKENVSKAMTDLRDIAKGLNGDSIRQLGFHTTIEMEVQRINRSKILQTSQVITGVEKEMDSQKKLILFRVIQECLQNVVKHANATSVAIGFCYTDSNVKISIADNGQGFNAEEKRQNGKGLGLLNMISRIALLKGSMQINSRLQEGTTIELSVPYE